MKSLIHFLKKQVDKWLGSKRKLSSEQEKTWILLQEIKSVKKIRNLESLDKAVPDNATESQRVKLNYTYLHIKR